MQKRFSVARSIGGGAGGEAENRGNGETETRRNGDKGTRGQAEAGNRRNGETEKPMRNSECGMNGRAERQGAEELGCNGETGNQLRNGERRVPIAEV